MENESGYLKIIY